MANKLANTEIAPRCKACGIVLLFGNVHRCIPTVSGAQDAVPATIDPGHRTQRRSMSSSGSATLPAPANSSTYRFRNPDKRRSYMRAYMRDYMRKRRAGVGKNHRPAGSP